MKHAVLGSVADAIGAALDESGFDLRPELTEIAARAAIAAVRETFKGLQVEIGSEISFAEWGRLFDAALQPDDVGESVGEAPGPSSENPTGSKA